ncbi:MAG: YjzC family protein [Phycisphaerae bacterium]|jgi:hypothetical protein
MDTSTYQRFKSGEICVESGWYEFDGYVDGTNDPLPNLTETEVALEAGDVFPPIQSLKRACYWKLVDGIGDDREAAAPSAPEGA